MKNVTVKIDSNKFHELRNEIFAKMVKKGLVEDTDKNFSEFDKAMGEIKTLEIEYL